MEEKYLFKKNYHIAIKYSLMRINNEIAYYPKKYPTPKYLLFMKTMAENGWKVRLYMAKVSKYVFISKNNERIKVRFSNHKPLQYKEDEGDCDYYVGVSNKNVITTDELLKKLLNTPNVDKKPQTIDEMLEAILNI